MYIACSSHSEYTYCQTLGKDEAHSRLSSHWNSWITEDDFKQIAAAGMNHVRIPIGYWSVSPLDGDPYVQGAYDILKQSLNWASSAGLKVLIDLHGGMLISSPLVNHTNPLSSTSVSERLRQLRS